MKKQKVPFKLVRFFYRMSANCVYTKNNIRIFIYQIVTILPYNAIGVVIFLEMFKILGFMQKKWFFRKTKLKFFAVTKCGKTFREDVSFGNGSKMFRHLICEVFWLKMRKFFLVAKYDEETEDFGKNAFNFLKGISDKISGHY